MTEGVDQWTVMLDRYERDNLLAAIEAIMDGPDLSPLAALNTGDWIGQLRWKLARAGAIGWPVIDAEARPNRRPEELRESARGWQR